MLNMTKELSIRDLLVHAYEEKASDLHLTAGVPPTYRIDGRLVPYGDVIVTREHLKEMVNDIVPEYKREEYEEKIGRASCRERV